jgi:hypothetical protein
MREFVMNPVSGNGSAEWNRPILHPTLIFGFRDTILE